MLVVVTALATLASAPVERGEPRGRGQDQLVVKRVQLGASRVDAGSSLRLRVILRNRSSRMLRRLVIRALVTPDRSGSRPLTLARRRSVERLPARAQRRLRMRVLVRASMRPGRYRLWVCATSARPRTPL